MRTITAALLLSLAMPLQAATESRMQENRPYTFDYFVHVDSGPKPTLIFGTGQTTYIQLPDGVEVQQVTVRKGNTVKAAEVFYSTPYTVIKELHDSLNVVTNKGSFIAERSGAKTEVELAAERAERAMKERAEAEAKAREEREAASKAKEQAELALKERAEAEAKAKEQEAELVKLREELKTKQAAGIAATASTGLANAGGNGAQVATAAAPGAGGGAVEVMPDAAAQSAPATPVDTVEVQIRSGEGLRAALARESEKLGVKLSWSLKEDRLASRDMVFNGSRDEVLNDILVAFRLPGYLVQNTGTLYIVKD